MFLIVKVFDYVRLLKCSITERSIAFDWQNFFFVSSITEPKRTQSSDWVRLPNVWLTSPGNIYGVGLISRFPVKTLLPVNKGLVITQLYQYLFSTGGTNYSKAFTRAFQLLKGSSAGKGSARRKVIVFLTDGKPTDSPKLIMETIKTKNAEHNDTVVIMTYGMLQNLQILRDIAEQNGTRYGVPKGPGVTVSLYMAVRKRKLSF